MDADRRAEGEMMVTAAAKRRAEGGTTTADAALEQIA